MTRSLRTLSAASVLTFCLSGCLLGPNYHRPTVDTPATYRFQENEAADLANTEWWKQFDDPVLNELIATALAENKDVKVAAARVDQFLGQFWSTRSQLLPQVGAGFNAGRERVTQAGPTPIFPGTGSIFNDYQA
jgi:multidrug efflux system outer membrane protein